MDRPDITNRSEPHSPPTVIKSRSFITLRPAAETPAQKSLSHQALFKVALPSRVEEPVEISRIVIPLDLEYGKYLRFLCVSSSLPNLVRIVGEGPQDV